MDNITIIKNIAKESESFKNTLVKDCQLHATAQCNGDYYFDEDIDEWVGYMDGNESKGRAVIGKTRETKIITRILKMTGTTDIPDFLTFQGDCRGLVIYMDESRMDEKEKELCRDLGLGMDFGGNYSIIKN